MDKQLKALERLIGYASYGISSGDYEIMNSDGYIKDMKQHNDDSNLLRKYILDNEVTMAIIKDKLNQLSGMELNNPWAEYLIKHLLENLEGVDDD